jgi:ribosomal protein L11 methyltransferase
MSRPAPRPMWRLRVAVTPESEDAVAALLEALCRRPASIYTDVQKDKSWATVYLPRASEWTPKLRSRIEAGLREIAALGLDVPRISVAAARLASEDWAESWKRHFKPLSIGRHLLVLPSWSRRKPLPGQSVVILDPGLSFGTGNHPTTRFCLEELVAARVRRKKTSLVDVGCGSGILAIAAARLGYERVVAFDFDPAAVRVASENAAQNDVQRTIHLSQVDLLQMRPHSRDVFDVVCANLTADLLCGQARKIAKMVALNGCLVLAGILDGQFGEVRAAFAKVGFALTRSSRKGEWRSGAFRAQRALPTRG